MMGIGVRAWRRGGSESRFGTNGIEGLGCPCCGGALAIVTAAHAAIECLRCRQDYPIREGIPELIRPENLAALQARSRRYREMRLAQGWEPLPPEHALALPFGSPPGYPAEYWRVRRQSYRAFRGWLARRGPAPAAGLVADLGAGCGWLSYRLALDGFHLVAVDANRDHAFGLGAAGVFLTRAHFLRAQGELDRPPLRERSCSLIVFNASLHYVEDLTPALRHAARALIPGGYAVVLDTPITRRGRAGAGPGRRHLGRRELHEALSRAGLRPRWTRVRRNARWWLAQAGRWARGARPFSFPMITAERL